MKLPNGQEINGLWIVLAILLAAFVIGLFPHVADLQWTQGR